MEFDQLVALEKMRSMNSQKELTRLLEKEGLLRQQLKAIQSYRKVLHGSDPTLSSMRSIGADVLWNKWLDQTQNTLNLSLARVLAEKAMVLQRARKDIGRAETVSIMRDQAHFDRVRAKKKETLDKMMDLSSVQYMRSAKG
ncbi:MAG: hypothetical protein ABJL99_02820 [Aliishimia sp.]